MCGSMKGNIMMLHKTRARARLVMLTAACECSCSKDRRRSISKLEAEEDAMVLDGEMCDARVPGLQD